MNDRIKTLLNLRRLRSISRELTLGQLEEALEKLSMVVEERQAEALQLRQEQADKKARLSAIAKQIVEQDLDVNELISLLSMSKSIKQRSKGSLRPAKYKYTDVNGKEKTWTGQGRIPAAIQDALNKGRALEDFFL